MVADAAHLRALSPMEAGQAMHRAMRHRSLRRVLDQLEAQIAAAEADLAETTAAAVSASAVAAAFASDEATPPAPPPASLAALPLPTVPTQVASVALPPVEVTIGTSAMAHADPGLVGRITTMVNTAYYESLKELLPEGTTSYERVSREDVTDRLEMGDAGGRANRVLHLGFRAGELVGCCSSTYQPPWTDEGCGHWGLLVVDPRAQGQGVASAIVAAAERRLAGCCQRVQIEYDYHPEHAPSEQLRGMYDKFGFSCSSSNGRRRRGSGGSEFRRCHKELPEALMRVQRPAYLRGVRESLTSDLAEQIAAQPGGIDRLGSLQRLSSVAVLADAQLAVLNGRTVQVVWFNDDDERYIVKLLPAEGDEEEDAGKPMMMSVDPQHLQMLEGQGPEMQELEEEDEDDEDDDE